VTTTQPSITQKNRPKTSIIVPPLFCTGFKSDSYFVTLCSRDCSSQVSNLQMKLALFFSFYFSVEFTSRFLLIFLLFHPITLVTVSLFYFTTIQNTTEKPLTVCMKLSIQQSLLISFHAAFRQLSIIQRQVFQCDS
jgi:hypothetical protein